MTNYQFSFSQCLRHAFMTGAGYGELDKIKSDDLARWAEYDPAMSRGAFKRMNELVRRADEVLDPKVKVIFSNTDGSINVRELPASSVAGIGVIRQGSRNYRYHGQDASDTKVSIFTECETLELPE